MTNQEALKNLTEALNEIHEQTSKIPVVTKAELLELLEGEEILSFEFEGCVGIKNGQIIRAGKVIVKDPTRKQLSQLMSDLAETCWY